MPKIDVRGIIVPNEDKAFYEWFGYEATSPADVRAVLDAAGGDTVDVYINSPGGEIASGSEIYTVLREYGNVKIHITGHACSAASVIAMAGWSEMSPTALLMIHCVSSSGSGNHTDFEHMAKILKTADEAMSSAYVDKTGGDREEFLKMMEEETWITAERAVELKMVDQIMEPQTQTVQMAAGAVPLLTREQKETARDMMEAKRKKEQEKAGKARARLRLLNLREAKRRKTENEV